MHTSTRLAAALLAAGLLATGCSSNSSDTADPKPSPSKTLSPEQKFLKSVHSAHFTSWADTGPTDDELLTYPDRWCQALEVGHSVKHMFGLRGENLYPVGMDWGTEKSEANELLVLAVTAYCPQYREKVTEELAATGEY